MKVIIVGGVAGGASCAARLRRLDEKAEIVMVERGPYRQLRELRSSVSRLGRDPAGVEPPRGERAVLQGEPGDRRADELRGGRHRPQEEDRRPEERHDRRGDDGTLRQARPLARGAVGPAAAAGDRPAGDLPGADRARRAVDPRVGREGHRVSGGDVQVLRDPVRQADAPRRRHRRRLHRSRDGGEPDPRGVRGDARRDARPDPRPARPRVRPPRRGVRQAARA